MLRTLRARRALAACAVVIGALASSAAIAQAQVPGYQETPLNSTSPDASQVLVSYVSIPAPLPAADGPHPAACDRIGYLRYRAADGPVDPSQADAIFVAQPGVLEGAAAFDQVARNTIIDAEAAGRHVEFWALSRRSNCLVDPTGLEAAVALQNPQVAFNYYFGGASIGGQKFAGTVSESQAAWLSHVGIAQTVEDEYTVISQLPPAVRKAKVLCGGHSLGGSITYAFANWDFSGDGNPADAGYNQCAGYFALDTRLELSASAAKVLAGPVGGLLNGVLGTVSTTAPYVNVAPATPETEYALPIIGQTSYMAPQTPSTLLNEFPYDTNFKGTYDLLLAENYGNFVTDTPDPRKLHETNETLVGDLFGDETQPLGFLRASLGGPGNGPIVERNFPVAYNSPAEFSGLLGGQPQGVPDPSAATANGPLFTWLNYNQITGPMALPQSPTIPYATPQTEVSDIIQFSRNLYQEAPTLFTEPYFPTQLALDSIAIASGDRTGTLAGLKYTNGITQHPAVYVDAGQGLAPQLDPDNTLIPNGPQPQVHVVAPGYNHLDVLTAARAQNNGQPELSSSTLASWAVQVLGTPAS